MEKRKINKVGSVLTVFSVMILIWVTISFAEVNAKNMSENPTYNSYNFFVLLAES